MKKHFLLKFRLLLLCLIVGGASSAWGETVNLSISDYSTANNWTNGSAYTNVILNSDLTATGLSNGNNSRYYSSNHSWRHYEGDNGTITISSSNGTLTSITFTYANGNNGVLKYSSTNYSSGTSCTAVSGQTSATFTIGHSSGTKSGNVQITAISVTYSPAPSNSTTASPTISGATPFLDNTLVTITNAASADGAEIYYTLNGDEPTTTTSATCFAYTEPFEISATTTVKAIAKKSTDTNASNVVSKIFTKATILTVTEALTAINALANNGTIADQYVRGIVCTTPTLYQSTSLTYYISADGTETNRLQVFRGKGIGGADFSSVSDVQVGDEVVVFGTLKNYSGTTPEFDTGNQLVSLSRKPAPTFTLDITSKTLDAYSHETVDITLTTNTDGTITCESDDEDVATVELKSGNVYTISAKTEGTATITISSAASANFAAASATVNVTVTDNRTDAGISFALSEIEKTWGESFTGQKLTNTNSVAVTWSSTDETVATVNATTGAINVLKAGTTTIKATFAGNATYKAAVASYDLTINKASAGISYAQTSFDIVLNDGSFVAPTLINPNNLTVTYSSNNENVAVVNVNTGELVYNEEVAGTAKITATFAGNDWYKSGSANYTINIIDPTVKGSKLNPYTVAEVNSGSYSGDNYVIGYIVGFFVGKDNVASTSGNSNLALSDTPNEIGGANTIAVQLPSGSLRTAWNIDDNNVIGYKVLVKGSIESYFSGKTGVKSPSEITAVSVPHSLNTSGYATFASTYALDFTNDSEFSAWQITEIAGNTITFSQIKGSVAAGTGVLLKGNSSETINIPVVGSGSDISTTNKLVGFNSITAVNTGEYYGLSGTKFVKVGAGSIPAGKALLPANEIPSSARELTFNFEGDDETTGISEKLTVKSESAAAFYDLQGRKVENPSKGLYIVNGRKVVVK